LVMLRFNVVPLATLTPLLPSFVGVVPSIV
jgi:hypothetical protein